MARCKRCLLPETVPGANLDERRICAFCRGDVSSTMAAEESRRLVYEADLEQAFRDCRGKAEYDCVLALSGGKDSIYLLYQLKVERGLKVLAFTTDMNIPPVAWDNIRRTVKMLDVDHAVFRPQRDFYKKLFRVLLQNQNPRGAVQTVCYVCAPLFEADALRLAMERNIPLVLAAYSPGQPDAERMTYEYSRRMICEEDWTPAIVRECGLFSDDELARFWNPHRYAKGTVFPRYLAPYHAWTYNQAEVMKRVIELGLIKNWSNASPVHSNCPVNWLLMYSDLRNLGYNPYAPEFSKLIREGKANLWYWRIFAPLVDFMIRRKIFLGKSICTSLDWLDLKEEQLVVIGNKEGAKKNERESAPMS